jgi:hypothetical protein
LTPSYRRCFFSQSGPRFFATPLAQALHRFPASAHFLSGPRPAGIPHALIRRAVFLVHLRHAIPSFGVCPLMHCTPCKACSCRSGSNRSGKFRSASGSARITWPPALGRLDERIFVEPNRGGGHHPLFHIRTPHASYAIPRMPAEGMPYCHRSPFPCLPNIFPGWGNMFPIWIEEKPSGISINN